MRRRHALQAAALAPWLPQAHAGQDPARPRIEWPLLQTLDGVTLRPADWQGRAAVVVFWATYCAYCRRHNAHVDKLHRSAPGQALRVLGVALDGDAQSVRRYMSTNGYGFPVVLDDGTLRQQFTSRRIIPMTCTVDRDGRLLQSIPGEMFEDDVLDLARVLRRPVT